MGPLKHQMGHSWQNCQNGPGLRLDLGNNDCFAKFGVLPEMTVLPEITVYPSRDCILAGYY